MMKNRDCWKRSSSSSEQDNEDNHGIIEEQEVMEIDEKKISTSGWKGSRNDAYKKKKAQQTKAKRSSLMFKKK